MYKLIAFLLLMIAPLAGAQAGEPEIADPTRPSYARAPVARETAPSWRVESILISPDRRVAVINGRSVGVGDWVNGAQVREILPYEVRLEYKGETRRAALSSSRVKTEAAKPQAVRQ